MKATPDSRRGRHVTSISLLVLMMAFIAMINAVGCSGAGTSSAERSDAAYKIPIALDGSLQNPAWSPDGTQIAFISERHGYPEIYVLDVEETLGDPAGAGARRDARLEPRARGRRRRRRQRPGGDPHRYLGVRRRDLGCGHCGR